MNFLGVEFIVHESGCNSKIRGRKSQQMNDHLNFLRLLSCYTLVVDF